MKSNRRLISVILAMLLAFGVLPMSEGVTSYASDSAGSAAVKTARSDKELYSLLSPLTGEPGEQFLPVTIDLSDGSAIVEGSGEPEPFDELYDVSPEISPKRSRSAELSSESLDKEEVLDILLEEPCIVHEVDDDTLRVAYPFSIKTLFVLLGEGQLEDTLGASNAIYDAEDQRYVLQYDSQADTAAAYYQLAEAYGADNVLIDFAVAPDETTVKYDEYSGNQTYSQFTSSKSLSWGTDVMHMDSLRDWGNQNLPGRTVYVAVIDTGIRVDENTEQIIGGYGIDASRIVPSRCQATVSSVYDYTALHDYSDSGWQPKKCAYADINGHGTHVMSTVLDGTPDAVKVFAIRDSCKNAKKYNSTTYALGDIDAMVKSIAKAGENDAVVVNISQAIDCYDYETGEFSGYYGKGISSMENISEATFDYYNNRLSYYINSYDLCVVGSAGNDSDYIEHAMKFPACNSDMIVVSNIKWPGKEVKLHDTSNYGENVSFCAPGVSIVGAGYDWDTHSACYVNKTGTSMSAPHITAAIANLRLYYPDLSRNEIVSLLADICLDIGKADLPGEPAGTPGRDEYYGYGVPQFIPINVTLVYNDGSTANEKVTIPRGMKFDKPYDPYREGYEFKGWYMDKNFTKEYDFSKPVISTKTLYAKWERIYRTVTFHYNGHGLYTTTSEEVGQYDYLQLPEDVVDDEWKFCGWYYEPEFINKITEEFQIYYDEDFYAKWEPKAVNPLSVKGRTASVKYSKLRKKAQSLAVTKVITFKKKGKGDTFYTLSSAKKGKKSYKKYFKVNGTAGKVTIKKGLKKGKYKLKVKVKSAGNNSYLPSSTKTVTITIKVK